MLDSHLCQTTSSETCSPDPPSASQSTRGNPKPWPRLVKGFRPPSAPSKAPAKPPLLIWFLSEYHAGRAVITSGSWSQLKAQVFDSARRFKDLQLCHNLDRQFRLVSYVSCQWLDASSDKTPIYPYWHQRGFAERNPSPITRS
jgi:hypothetical protein